MSEGEQTEGVVVEQTQSPADLLQKAEAIKQRLLDAQEQREIEIKQKMGDRESLLASLKTADGDLKKAEVILADYNSAIEAATSRDIPLDESAIRGREEIQALVESLREQLEQTEKSIGAISSQNEVSTRLHSEALSEDVSRNIEKEKGEAEKRLDEMCGQLEQEISTLSGIWEKENRALQEEDQDYRKMVEEVYGLQKMAYSKFQIDLNLGGQWISTQTFIEKLDAIKNSLGFFDRDKKKAIGQLIKGAPMLDKANMTSKKLQARSGDMYSLRWGPLQPVLEQLQQMTEIRKKHNLHPPYELAKKLEEAIMEAKVGMKGELRDRILNFTYGS